MCIMAGPDIIHLRGLDFYAFHGVLPEEHKLGQRFIVDLDLYLDLRKAGSSDEVKDTVNYGDVYLTVKECAEGDPVNLLERLAERIAQTVLERFACSEVRVEVHKAQAPVPGIFRDIAVEIRRGNDEIRSGKDEIRRKKEQ
ncbi:dihydroneopterin aldolase [Peptococcaceae bacterium CEB3]|nr:dihydroneopterin aldolase [Peptococcaceae bacterium CEB3]